MNKNRILAILLMIGLISTMGICAADDVREPGQPGGGNPPTWSNVMFKTIDTVCNFMNGPLEIGIQKVAALGAKSKTLVTILLAYFSYSAKDKVASDVERASGLVKQVLQTKKQQQIKKHLSGSINQLVQFR